MASYNVFEKLLKIFDEITQLFTKSHLINYKLYNFNVDNYKQVLDILNKMPFIRVGRVQLLNLRK